MFKNFYKSLNSLEYQYSVHISLFHLLSNFQDAIIIGLHHNKSHFSTHFNALYFRNKRAEQLICC